MDWKLIFAIVATIIAVIAFVPYITDTLKGKTQPHVYTWLVFLLAQGLAAAGVWYGGGHWGTLEITAGTGLILIVFILSLFYGTKNITKFDTIALVICLGAMVIWWQLHNPALAVGVVTFIDVVGYVPTIRKAYQEPGSETITTWLAFFFGNLFFIAALKQYNFLTLSFVVATSVANLVLISIISARAGRKN